MTTFKKNDDGDPIRAQLRDEDGVVDLSDVDEVNIFFFHNGEKVREYACDIVDAENGKVKYEWRPDDPIYTSGTYEVEFKATESGGQISFPSEGYVSIRVE